MCAFQDRHIPGLCDLHDLIHVAGWELDYMCHVFSNTRFLGWYDTDRAQNMIATDIGST